MSDTWTPGPWVVIGGGSSLYIRSADGENVCQTARHSFDARDEIEEANARLIAACPTMYAYIAKKAQDGDADAARILAAL